MATMTLSAQEVCFLAAFSELNTKDQELVRSVLTEMMAGQAAEAAVAGGAA